MVESISATVRLNDGADMPGFGFGCYKASGPELALAVREAVACGYRYIDTAAYYHNEDTVGEALRHSGLARETLFVLSKIWPTDFDEPVRALDRSLKLLGLDYLDGYLLHWPGLDSARRLRAFEQLLRRKEEGKIRVLGVSNFLEEQLSELRDVFGFWPAINQIEVHPLFSQAALCRFCARCGIQVVSWSPLGRGREMENPAVRGLAADLGKTPAQILLRWHLEKGLLPIPKSVHAERVRENAAVFDFRLTPEQVAVLDGIELPDCRGRMGPDPLSYPR
ncbi:aldo/keto reductase [Desulfovibrio sp. PG-178-WT-4]|uniref:Aldo/keto reductase n=1 Tax=Desulfovibrio porci TaxID=2605782 RepID=A0A6L5XKS6_9BACT|nr:aldo/keto reductase [Desulfovibrio porci]MSS27787.1 aldo/keto reductase [Desulfovibrio porci]